MKKWNTLITALLLSAAIWMAFSPRTTAAAPPPQRNDGEVDPALEKALQDKLGTYQAKIMGENQIGFTIDKMVPSSDGRTSLLWLAPVDLSTGEVIATEPALAVGIKDATQANGWRVVLSDDAQFLPSLSAFPANLLPIEMQLELSGQKNGLDSTIDATVYRGYMLPWAAGVSKRLTGSIGHFLIYNSCSVTSCRYAYDFADGTMFPLLAAKGGVVRDFYDGCYNGDSTCTNYLILEDASTSPSTWQIYYHMAQNSIPTNLKKSGAPVLRGQFVGNADDTGYSSGNHVHFQVTSSIYYTTTYYGQRVPWGNSVDIRFDDVTINDGTPRTCYEAANWPAYGTQCSDTYVSGNVGANPATATLTAPDNGSTITGPTLTIGGTAADDRGVVKIQAVARNRGGNWANLGDPTSGNSFNINAGICSANLQNGLIDLGVVVWDYEGNVSIPQGVRSLVKNYSCTPVPPAACSPTADQISIYSEPNYSGACKKLGPLSSAYSSSSFSPVGAKDIASIQVGANVRAVASTVAMTYIFDVNNQQIITSGRIEAFEASDPNLADNAVGSDTIQSLVVQARNTRVSDDDVVTFPILDTTPTANTVSFPTRDSLAVSFYEPGGTSFWVQLFRDVSGTFVPFKEYNNLAVPAASLGSLPPGNYRLWACGKAAVTGTNCSNKTPYYYFTVTAVGLPVQAARAAPWSDSLDTNSGEWTASGLWRWGDLSEGRKGFIYNQNGSYTAGGNNYGALTSPPIQIPAAGASLRFQYRYDTESPYPFWDQRWVQVAVEGGQFTNVAQLSDDPRNFWLTSQDIDLSAYKGQTVRVRFFFFSGDASSNSGSGWQIDQVSIGLTSLQATCSDTNNSLATAMPVAVNQHITGQYICPAGDVDYFKFSGKQYQQLGIWIDAARDGSALDPVLTLLDKNGSLIYENDDQVQYVVPDSNLTVILPETGDYYLKVKAWNHPGAGGPNYPYSLHLVEDSTPPNITITAPGSIWPTNTPFAFTADGQDGSSRIMQMDFYWHPADWQGGTWQLIGSDYSGSDGWGLQVDPLKLGELKNSALYAEAKDAAGNISGQIKITAQLDSVPPSVKIDPLPAVMDTTAFKVIFSASDDIALQSLSLQSRTAGGTWGGSGSIYPAGEFSEWYVGTPGSTVEFQASAIDTSGNTSSASASTQISSSCAPDAYESGDNTQAGATPLVLGQAQQHNFCSGDVDWAAFNVEANKSYRILATSLGGGAAFRLEVFAADGTTLLTSGFSANLGESAFLLWKPAVSGKVFLKVSPVVPELSGTAVRYSLILDDPQYIYYFPFVGK